MPQSTNLNVSPYYDDFDVNKDFYRVLFRPGYSIQSRELTTLQSILQNQVESIGKSIVKEGSMVVPGEVSYNSSYNYIKLSSFSQGFALSEFIGATLTGETTGVTAKVINASDETSEDAVTLYVNYVSSGTSNTNRVFQEGEILSTDIVGAPTAVVGITGSTKPTVYRPVGSTSELIQNSAVGKGAAVFVQEGIYFTNGHYVRNSTQTLIIDKYSTTPTCRVGFLVQEEVITPEEDQSLNDNAAGYSNYAAPGGHRLKITLTLASREIDSVVESNFIELLRIRNGVIERKIEKKSWSDLEEILARRTYDESGDYIVRNYTVDLKEHKNNGTNNGFYSLDPETNLYNGLTSDESDGSMVAAISPGKAYVRGYEIENVGTKFKTLEKARDTFLKEKSSLTVPTGSFINVQNVYGSTDVSNVSTSGVSTETSEQVVFYNSFTDSYLGNTKLGRGDGPQTRYLVQIENISAQATYDWTNNVIGMKSSAYPAGAFSGSINDISKLGFTAPIGTIQNGVASTAECDTHLALLTLGSGAFFPVSGQTIEDADVNLIGSTTPRAIIRRVWELPGRPIGCAHPKYLKLSNGIVDDNGKLASEDNINSVFRLGLFDTSTFTTIKCYGTAPVGNFTNGIKTLGARLTGSSSGASGIVEMSYTGDGYDEIFLSNIRGSFQEGEVIVTDPDYGNEGKRAQGTIIKSGTIKKIHISDPGTGYSTTSNPAAAVALSINNEQVRVSRTLGNDIYAFQLNADTNGGVYSLPIDDGTNSGSIFPNKWSYRSPNATVYSKTPVATILANTGSVAATLEVELWGETITTNAVTDFKSVTVPGGNQFSADVVSDSVAFTNLIEISQVSGAAGNDYFEVTSLDKDPRKLLNNNDIIKVIDDSGAERRYLVYRVEKSDILARSRIYIAGTITSSTTNAQLYKVESLFGGFGQNSLVVPMPDSTIKTVARDKNKTKFSLKAQKQLVSTIGNDGTISFNLNGNDEDFQDFSEQRFNAVVADAGSSSGLSQGDVIDLSRYQIQRVSATAGVNASISFSGIPNTFYGAKIKLTAAVILNNAKPRTKILRNAQVQVSTYNKKDIISLGKTDGFRMNAVYMSADPDSGATVTDIDIKDRFYFDNGQRDNLYDMVRIVRGKNTEEPSGQLLVDFDYFDHTSNDGDYFSVDSYINPNNLSLTYGDIPEYRSEKYGIIELRDALDFRLSADTGFASTNVGNVAGAEDKREIGALTFKSINNVIPSPGDTADYECEFYLSRRDSVYLSKSGSFEIVSGNPSTNPQYPKPIEDALRLFDLDIPAYTFSPKDIKVQTYNYRRYTMADLRTLEKRVEKIEYYTQLSMLEQDTLNTSIKDAVTGLDRFKSGMIVDNFAGHNIGDALSNDYRCSVDMQSQQMRPRHFTDQVELQESVSDDASRASLGYRKSGSIVTLDFTPDEFVSNKFATKTINLNPFLQFQYKGVMEISPEMDEWKDVESRPDLIVQNNTLFDTISSMADERGVLGTIWNEWQTSWSGSEVIASDQAIIDSRSGRTQTGSATRRERQSNTGRQQIRDVTTNTFQNFRDDDVLTTSITARTRTRTRTGTRNQLTGFDTVNQAFGNRVVGVNFIPFMRTRAVGWRVTGLKPNTRLYAFFDAIDVNGWVCPDSTYTGEPESSPKGFGQPIISDAEGSVSGVFIVPNGFPPINAFDDNTVTELASRGISGDDLNRRRVSQSSSTADYSKQRFTGNVDDIIYNSEGTFRQFRVGESTLRFTSSSKNASREDEVDTFAEKEYFAIGLMETQENTIMSTRVPTIAQRTVSDSDTAQFVDGVRTNTDTRRTNTGTTQTTATGNWFDPVAQTFLVEGYNEGVFMTELDVFFKTKSDVTPTECYLTETKIGTPGKKIIPFSHVQIQPDTKLRVVSDSAISFISGESVVGTTSGASGTVKSNLDIAALSSNTNFSNSVYTLVLDNHNGVEFLAGENIKIQRFPEPTSIISIAEQSHAVVNGFMRTGGTGYTSASVSISAPEQVGGVQATAIASVSTDGSVNHITITDPGSGYVSEPSINIQGDGAGATAMTKIRLIQDPVSMGVSISEDATAATKFKFQAPVFLENNKEYAFVVLSNSLDYNMYVSRLGDTEIGTTQRVSQQPLLGSLFKSQNSTVWTADQFEDVKFTLYRAKFDTSSTAIVQFNNKSLPLKSLENRPIETNKLSYRGGQSIGESIFTSSSAPTEYSDSVFGGNPRIVRVHHYNHGMNENDFVVMNGITGIGTGDPSANGIGISKLNTLHQIENVSHNSYEILVPKDAASTADQATESGRVGGNFAFASQNQQFQVIQPQIGLLQFAGTVSGHTVTALKSSSIDYSNPSAYSTGQFSVSPGSNTYLTDNYQILSEINEVKNNNGEKSFTYSVTLSTEDDSVSPVIDLDRVNMFVTMNLIDNPKPTAPRFGYHVYRIYPFDSAPNTGGSPVTSGIALGSVIQQVYKVDSNGNRNFTTGSVESISSVHIQAEVVGINTTENYIDIRYLKIPTTSINSEAGIKILNASQRFEPQDPTNSALTSYVFQVAGSSTDFYLHTPAVDIGGYLYRDETESEMGSFAAKYQTKTIKLENPATNIDLRLTANLFNNKDLQVLYKIKPTTSDKAMNQQPWRYFNPKSIATSTLKEIKVLDSGSGYNSSPNITLNPQNGVELTPVINSGTGELEKVLVTKRGTGFITAPEVVVDDSTGGSGNAISARSVTQPGSGYSPTIGSQAYNNTPAIYDASSPVNLPSAGSGATFDINVTNGAISSATVNSAGSGYNVGEILTINPNFDGSGSGSGLTVEVTGVTVAGAPTSVAIAEAIIFPVDFDEDESGYADNIDDIQIENSDILDPALEDPDAFKEYRYTVEDLQEFDSFAVKVLMKVNAKGPAFVPKIEDLRAIANI
jgi:hypothetical protein